jgi:hypothetical protein
MVSSSGLATELTDTSDELRALAHRLQREGEARPRIELSAWTGPANWACRLSLAVLDRELEAATELLRCAAELTSAAAWEVRSHG